MIYEFNGDDDLWVFIDNVLVLDIGGVHDAHSGSINFSTGDVVWYNCKKNEEPVKYSTTLKAIFQNAKVLPSGNPWSPEGAKKSLKEILLLIIQQTTALRCIILNVVQGHLTFM